MQDYEEFLRAKACIAQNTGFDVDESEINPIMKPHYAIVDKPGA